MIIKKRKNYSKSEYFDIISSDIFLKETSLAPIINEMSLDEENIAADLDKELWVLFIFRPWIYLDEKKDKRRILNTFILYEDGVVKFNYQFLDMKFDTYEVFEKLTFEKVLTSSLEEFKQNLESGNLVYTLSPHNSAEESLLKDFVSSFKPYYEMEIGDWTFSTSLVSDTVTISINKTEK